MQCGGQVTAAWISLAVRSLTDVHCQTSPVSASWRWHSAALDLATSPESCRSAMRRIVTYISLQRGPEKVEHFIFILYSAYITKMRTANVTCPQHVYYLHCSDSSWSFPKLSDCFWSIISWLICFQHAIKTSFRCPTSRICCIMSNNCKEYYFLSSVGLNPNSLIYRGKTMRKCLREVGLYMFHFYAPLYTQWNSKIMKVMFTWTQRRWNHKTPQRVWRLHSNSKM